MSNQISYLFPGQGSQFVGMGKELRKNTDVSLIYEQASEILGYNLIELINHGPEERLTQTQYAQPAILVDSIAKFTILSKSNQTYPPACVAGHSLGEYSALVAANSITFPSGVQLVRLRGRLMSNVNEDGSMLAVLGLHLPEVKEVLNSLCEAPIIANYNFPTQLVLSGRASELNEARNKLANQGAKCIELNVSGPFHTKYMNDAQAELAEQIQQTEFDDPEFPVLSSVSGDLETDSSRLQKLLSKQMTTPVRWMEYMNTLDEENITTTVEVGPGDVLQKINNRIVPNMDHRGFSEVIHL